SGATIGPARPHASPARSCIVAKDHFLRSFLISSSSVLICAPLERHLPSLPTTNTLGSTMTPYCVASLPSSPPAWYRWVPGAGFLLRKSFASLSVESRLTHNRSTDLRLPSRMPLSLAKSPAAWPFQLAQ